MKVSILMVSFSRLAQFTGIQSDEGNNRRGIVMTVVFFLGVELSFYKHEGDGENAIAKV